MFRSARLKLTAWYLLIIMVISVAFSVTIYEMLTFELDRVERAQRLRIERGLPQNVRIVLPTSSDGDEFRRILFLDPNIIEETKNRLKIILIAINLGILGASALAGYFLAGRTLRPISQMVDEQNRFITDASHELRTPLTSLKSEIEVNLRDQKLTLGDAKKTLESNLEEVNHLQILSDNLIKISRYQKGENHLQISQVSILNISISAIKKVANLAKLKKIKIVNKVQDISIEGEEPSLTELLVILLDNAIKYSPDKTEVHLFSEKTDGHIKLKVSDEGLGIAKEDIPHLFDRFYRSDKSRTKTEIPGYGLGLAIAKQIVERHLGSIEVQSQLNRGSAFTIQLPRKHSREGFFFGNKII